MAAGSEVTTFVGGAEGFSEFVSASEPRLRMALMATYGTERGRDATAEALAACWERWEEVRKMANPVGWCYRVGQSRIRDRKSPQLFFRPEHDEPWVEPGLPKALARLPRRQRVAVVLVHGYGVSVNEVASVLGIAPTSVRTHLSRGLDSLRRTLNVSEVTNDR
jgi:DNA-directed RNA polymerase specialized sigma24 family protein